MAAVERHVGWNAGGRWAIFCAAQAPDMTLLLGVDGPGAAAAGRGAVENERVNTGAISIAFVKHS